MSHRVLIGVVIVMCLTGARAAEQGAIQVKRVKTTKLVYSPGEQGRVYARIVNGTGIDRTVRAQCTIVSDVDTRSLVGATNISIQAGAGTEVGFDIDCRHETWGRYAEVALLQDGRVLDVGRDIFAVARNPYRVTSMAPGTYDTAVISRDVFNQGHVRDIADILGHLRRNGCAVVEYQFWSPGHWAQLGPVRAEWTSSWGSGVESVEGVETLVTEATKRGMTVVTYYWTGATGGAGVEFARQHPEWICYDADGRPHGGFDLQANEARMRLSIEAYKKSGKRGQSAFGLWLLDRDNIDWGIQQLVALHERFGIRGVRWDGHPALTTVLEEGAGLGFCGMGIVTHDYSGARWDSVIEDVDVWSAATMRYIISRLREKIPDYVMAYNNSPELMGKVFPSAYPRTWQTITPGAMSLDETLTNTPMYNSQIREGAPPDIHALWVKEVERIVTSVDYVKPVGGYHFIGNTYPGKAVYTRHYLNVLMASGSRNFGTPTTSISHRFAFRYSGLLWPAGLKRLDAARATSRIHVSASKPLWWKWWVSEQTEGDTSRLVVHLQNPPVKPYIDMKEEVAPDPCHDITLSTPLPAGYDLAGAWVLTPDRQPEVEPLPARVVSGRVVLPVQDLTWWNVVVIDFTRRSSGAEEGHRD